MIKKNLFIIVALILIGGFLSLPEMAHAAASYFKMDPSSGSFIQGCEYTADILIQTGTDKTNAADVILKYDTTKIEIIDSDPSISGTQIITGAVYEGYVGNVVNTTLGEIRLVGLSSQSTFSGNGIFATIEFKPKSPATSGGFTFEFTGSGPYISLDSNIADSTTGNDILTAVTNASYTFKSGSCPSDTSPPSISFIYPVNYQTGVAASSNIQFQITDGDSGVDITTLKVTVNGIDYTYGDSEVAYTGDPSLYFVTVNPADGFPSDESSIVTVLVKDDEGNQQQSSIEFNIPEGESPTLWVSESELPETGLAEITSSITSSLVGEEGAFGSINNELDAILEDIDFLNTSQAREIVSKYAIPAFLIPLIFQLIIFLSLLLDFIARNLKTAFLGFLIGKGYFKGTDIWGGVYSSADNKPIKGALVSLGTTEGKFISATLTNSNGEFGFLLPPGEYVLRIIKNGWEFPSLNKIALFSGLVKVEIENNMKVFYSGNIKASRMDFFMDPNYFVKYIDEGPGKKNIVLYILWNIQKVAYIFGLFSSVLTYATIRLPLYLSVVVLYLFIGFSYIVTGLITNVRIKGYLRSVSASKNANSSNQPTEEAQKQASQATTG